MDAADMSIRCRQQALEFWEASAVAIHQMIYPP